MPVYLPTAKIVDERVIAQFRKMSLRDGGDQHFSTYWDLTLDELCDKINGGDLFHYAGVLKATNFSLPKEVTLIGHDEIEKGVIDSYKNWLVDIATDRIMPKLHENVLKELDSRNPGYSNKWQRAGELTKRRDELTADEKKELIRLESSLESNDYMNLRLQMQGDLIAKESKKVFAEYKL